MQKVYELHHTRDKGTADENDKKIGTYDSYQLAKDAINRIKDKPGFIDFSDDFQIIQDVINREGWLEGFVTC